MLKIALALFIIVFSLNAQVKHIYGDKHFFQQNSLKIIDIRTQQEWKETGIIPHSYTLTFFDEKGKYNIPKFMSELEKIVSKNESFAMICRTGSRTRLVTKFLDKNGYKVSNLIGGIVYAKSTGMKLVPYK